MGCRRSPCPTISIGAADTGPTPPVIFVNILDFHSTDLIGKIMVLRAGDGMWQVGQPKLPQSGQEARQLLPAECAENDFCGLRRSSARHQQAPGVWPPVFG
jgi:hypothetical protein